MTETTTNMVHTSRMMVTKETRDTLYDQELLPYPDLASRLEELVRLAKIGKQFENGELVKEVEVVKTVTVEVPVKSDDSERSEPQKSADIPVAKKSFEQLKQTRTTDGGLERVRRAVAAIKEHNLRCGGNKRDMWAINIRTLKDLTGVRTSTVENYFQADGQEELSIRFEANGNGKPRAIVGYNEMEGLGMHHNRGRGSVRQAIKLA